ncbi:unnamed protein product [Ceratitis capitata]|uniref:(Mediterranean fruit fly) hypothetical protein n=1 Tax=Ceratitis capitata TaxID=7213 RepID=A0A811VHU7_CERCA|nr:unnamed protein product [Ceratitis capitata]
MNRKRERQQAARAHNKGYALCKYLLAARHQLANPRLSTCVVRIKFHPHQRAQMPNPALNVLVPSNLKPTYIPLVVNVTTATDFAPNSDSSDSSICCSTFPSSFFVGGLRAYSNEFNRAVHRCTIHNLQFAVHW